jgi:hypothetical protein
LTRLFKGFQRARGKLAFPPETAGRSRSSQRVCQRLHGPPPPQLVVQAAFDQLPKHGINGTVAMQGAARHVGSHPAPVIARCTVLIMSRRMPSPRKVCPIPGSRVQRLTPTCSARPGRSSFATRPIVKCRNSRANDPSLLNHSPDIRAKPDRERRTPAAAEP